MSRRGSSAKPAPRRSLAGGIAFALLWVASTTWLGAHALLVDQRLTDLGAAPVGAPAPAVAARRILPGIAIDGYVWLHNAQQLAMSEEWRVRRSDFDNAPYGREVHWSSGYALWLWLTGWLYHAASGAPIERAIERIAPFANLPLLVGLGLLLSGYAARTLGWRAGALIALGMTTSGRFYEGFYPAYVDHHGLASACALGTLLGIAVAGASARSDAQSPARAPFLFSAACGAVGLWVSAASQTAALIATATGSLAAALLLGSEQGARDGARHWALWGRTGAVLSLAFYLFEYFPSHLAMRLEVNHPLYALAWWSGGELLAVLVPSASARRWPSGRRELVRLALSAVGLLALPGCILVGGPAWHSLRDPFLSELHTYVYEFQPYRFASSIPLLVSDLSPLAVVAVLAIGLLAVRSVPLARRRALLAALVATALLLGLSLWQSRWILSFAGTLVVSASLGAEIALREAERRSGPALARVGLAALLVALLATGPVRWLSIARDRLAQPFPSEQLQVLLRDVAATLRAHAGARRGVLLSSPASTTPLAYFSGMQGLGTLYWENREGLRAAALIHSAVEPGEALALLRERRVTHLALLTHQSFIGPYFKLTHPESVSGQESRAFAFRLLHGGSSPAWLRPLPYHPSPELEKLGVGVRLFEVVPDAATTPRSPR